MQFLKTLFWIVLTVIAVAFAFKNWNSVELLLRGNIVVEVKLPALFIIVFLIGFLPTFVIYRARVWSLRRRLDTQVNAHVANRPAMPVRVPPAAPAGNGPPPSL